MPAEKKDRHTGADNANADSSNIFAPKRCFPDHSAPDPLSALSRAQNPAAPPRECSPERTSEFANRSACCSSSPVQKPASDNRASAGAPAATAPPSTSAGYKAAAPTEIEPGLRSPGEYCLT